MDTATRQTSPLERLAQVWGRRKWIAILTFLPLATAVVSVVAALPNLYQSSALVLVERQQVPEEFVRSTVTSAIETRLQTINQEILSRSRLEQLISRFGLYPDLRRRVSPEEVIEAMRRDIQLELRGAEQRGNERSTIAFSLSYRGSDAQTVAQVTNTLASFYIEENLKVRERQAAGTADFLKIQLDQVKAKLDQQEKQVGEFKKSHVGELPQEMEVNLATLERLNTQLRLNGDNQVRALERRDALLRQIAELTQPAKGATTGDAGGPGTGAAATAAMGAAPYVLPPAPPNPIAARLARLQQELAELKTRFSDKYPDVIRLKAEIADTEKELADERVREAAENPATGAPMARPGATTPAQGPSPLEAYLFRTHQAVAEVESELKVLKAEETRLHSAIQGYQQRVQDTPLREQQYKELARDYDSTRELYASLLKRLAESQIAESMEQRQKGEQFRVIDPALPSDKPIAPDRVRLLGVGLALALGAAFGLVLLAEHLDTGFHTVDDLRGFTTVPILASIPRIVTSGDTRRSRRRFRVAAAGAVIGLALVAGGSFWAARGNERLAVRLTRQS
jgi:polysaccharide chain length determinant protein (PEP-CTERM system associated)